MCFSSIGAGSGDAEINMARWLKESGTTNFRVGMSGHDRDSAEKGRRIAAENGVEDFLSFSVLDLNGWRPRGKYHAVQHSSRCTVFSSWNCFSKKHCHWCY